MKNKQNKMVMLSFLSIIVSMSLTNCKYDSDTATNNKTTKTSNKIIDSTKIDFNFFIEQVENEEEIKYETLTYFLPDSVISKISRNNILDGKFKIKVNNQVVLKINSSGELNGDILLFSFSELGKLNDYMIITRYCKADCENIGKAKEILITNRTNGFEFEIIETENSDPNAMPLFKDNQVLKQKKYKLNELGKFIVIN